MLRKFFPWTVCFLLLALVAPMAHAQDPDPGPEPEPGESTINFTVHVGSNIPVAEQDPDAIYVTSLNDFWTSPAYSTLKTQYENRQGHFTFILHADDNSIPANQSAFFRVSGVEGSGGKSVAFISNDPLMPRKISIGADTSFLYMADDRVPLTIDRTITIEGAGGTGASTRNATTRDGGTLTASGVTYQGKVDGDGTVLQWGGPVVLFGGGSGGTTARGTQASDYHPTVTLDNSTFNYNRPNVESNGAVLSLVLPSTYVNLKNSTFTNNDGFGVYIYVSDSQYRANEAVVLDLTADGGLTTLFRDNVGSIKFNGSRGAAGWAVAGRITANVGGSGTFDLYDDMLGERENYNLTINKTGSGTWIVREGSEHEFSAYRLSSDNNDQGGTHINMNSGVLHFEADTKFLLGQEALGGGQSYDRNSFNFSGGRTEFSGLRTYIQSHNMTFGSGHVFEIKGALLKDVLTWENGITAYPTAPPDVTDTTPSALLTIKAEDIAQQTSTIRFNFDDISGNISKLLVYNLGGGTFRNTANDALIGSNNGRINTTYPYQALINGQDIYIMTPFVNEFGARVDRPRYTARIERTDDGKGLYLKTEMTNYIVSWTSSSRDYQWTLATGLNWQWERDINKPAGWDAAFPDTPYEHLIQDPFVHNDAVIFGNYESPIIGNQAITIRENGVKIAQQTNFLTDHANITNDGGAGYQWSNRTEYGLRFTNGVTTIDGNPVNVSRPWTLNGGFITDDYDPYNTVHDAQNALVGRVTHETSGTVSILTDKPNTFHDGFLIKGFRYNTTAPLVPDPDVPGRDIFATENVKNTLVVSRPDALGDAEYAGNIADIGGGYVIQHEGFGLMIDSLGSTITINQPNNLVDPDEEYDPDTNPYRVFNGRILVAGGAVADITLNQGHVVDETTPERAQVISVSNSYWFGIDETDHTTIVDHRGRFTYTFDEDGQSDVIDRGAAVVVDMFGTLNLDGYFDFVDNNLYLIRGATVPTDFDGGVIWSGTGANVNVVGSSFHDNGKIYTIDLDGNIITADTSTVRHGGAIYFRGGLDAGGIDMATLTVSERVVTQPGDPEPMKRNEYRFNYAEEGGAIYTEGDLTLGSTNRTIVNADGATFSYNAAVGGRGGAVFINQNTDLNLVDTVFEYNGREVTLDPDGRPITGATLTTLGGAIFADQGAVINADSIVAGNSKYVGNAALGDGGAIFVRGADGNNSSLSFSGTLFDANRAGGILGEHGAGDGGAIFAHRTVLSGNGSTFRNNVAFDDDDTGLGSGGAIYVNDMPEIDTLIDYSNQAINLKSTKFEANEATLHGGALAINSGHASATVPTVLFIDGVSEFKGNKTHTETASLGGAIYAPDPITIYGQSAVFTDNMRGADGNGAGLSGGAVYTEANANLNFLNASFTNNGHIAAATNGGAGGAIHTLWDSRVDVRSTGKIDEETKERPPLFIGNRITDQGGAIYMDGADGHHSTLLFGGTGFVGNQTGFGEGGAIYSDFTILQGNESYFRGNQAGTDGGGIHIAHVNPATQTIELDNTKFLSNTAGNPTTVLADGGAIHLADDMTTVGYGPTDTIDVVLNANDSAFNANRASQHGGAIYSPNAYTTINVERSVFSFVEPTLGDRIGNRAGGSGGAIYMTGEDNGEATSTLNANRATFNYNEAGSIDGGTTKTGGNGGALYLEYVNTKIVNTVFEYNKAYADGTVGGLGGAIYFVNKPATELSIETAIFRYNEADRDGGALYLENKTIIHAKNTTIGNNTAGDNGGVFYFNDANYINYDYHGGSEIDLTGATLSNNKALTGDGGVIWMGSDSKVIAGNARFSGNTAGTSGGAIRMEGTAHIQADGATFTENKVTDGSGGAIYVTERMTTRPGDQLLPSDINVNGGIFFGNRAGLSGGAIHAEEANINVASTKFENNIVGTAGLPNPTYGGAIYASNSELNVRGASFLRNEARGTNAVGGAIYYHSDDPNVTSRIIGLGADNGKVSEFSGNLMNGVSNSIYLDIEERIDLAMEIETEGTGHLNMLDPIILDGTNNDVYIDIDKTGTGKWSLGGVNDFRHATVGATVDIHAGTFELVNGGSLLLTNADHADHFNLDSGAVFATKSTTAAPPASRLETSDLHFATGTRMELGNALVLDVDNAYSIGSVLTGTGNLTKEDGAVLQFFGRTDNYRGNVEIQDGTFQINKHNDVVGSGHFETTGTFNMAEGTDLYIHADPNRPSLVAKSADLDLVNLHISGISGNYKDEFILIHTTDGIEQRFDNVDSQLEGGQMSVDYLTYSLGYLNYDAGKGKYLDYGGMIELRWYSSDDDLKAWGNFTLEKASDYFKVDVELRNNSVNLFPGRAPGETGYWGAWDGATLDKYGDGTLELARANKYTGPTTVHEGRLMVTNPEGTGLGPAAVTVNRGAELGLGFTGKYTKQVIGGVDGDGDLAVYEGVVELANAQNDYGRTLLKGGVLAVDSQDKLGNGAVRFEGGTFRSIADMEIDLPMEIADGRDAKFDTLKNLVVSGAISDSDGMGKTVNGNLIKTGLANLTLTAENPYTGTTQVQEGGLILEGSVGGNARVFKKASIAGAGIVGGNLVMNSGSYYDWYFSPDRDASGPLNVLGMVTLGDGVVFRPRTENTDFTESIEGWTVLRYGNGLNGYFASIDNSYNAFYDFELDYSVQGEVRVAGELLKTPRPLSDVVATGLMIANRKLYRNPFAELARSGSYRRTPVDNADSGYRGQVAASTGRSFWYTPMARANKFGTNYIGGKYDFNAYGMQVGSTLYSNRNNALGLMLGYERGTLKNHLDRIRSHDYYLGLYYGHMFNNGYELRTFVGGGYQKFTTSRSDLDHSYSTSYNGSSFELNVEYGRYFAGQNGTLVRPFIAADWEYADQQSSQEKAVGNAYRHYKRAYLSQFLVRFGLDLEKRWQRVDLNGGISYAGMLFGRTQARGEIYYPVRDAYTMSRSARMGRSTLTLKTGLNWHLNPLRTFTVSVDYFADIYMDRGGDPVMHTGGVTGTVRY